MRPYGHMITQNCSRNQLKQKYSAPVRKVTTPNATAGGADGMDLVRRILRDAPKQLSEIGVLELWCVSRDGSRRWKLEYNVRERPAGVPGAGSEPTDFDDEELEIEIEGGE